MHLQLPAIEPAGLVIILVVTLIVWCAWSGGPRSRRPF
jgi:hypothetical protein